MKSDGKFGVLLTGVYIHQVPYIMELVTDIRYFINKNQKAFTFFWTGPG